MMRGLLASLNANGRASTAWVVHECGRWLCGAAGDVGVRRSLLDLGLDARKLPPRSRAQLRRETASLSDCARGSRSWRRIAMRFFTWYVMQAPDFTPRALTGEGAVAGAIAVIASWCRADPELVKVGAPDFHRLRAHLFYTPEGTAAPE